MVRGWLRRHPSKVAVLRLESEENYVAITFSRFWQATSLNQKVEFRTLIAALQYLRASLHGTILDTLRAFKLPKEVTLLEMGEPVEFLGVDHVDSSEAWRMLQLKLSDQRELRLAYLLYHCGLKPREIVYFCAQE